MGQYYDDRMFYYYHTSLRLGDRVTYAKKKEKLTSRNTGVIQSFTKHGDIVNMICEDNDGCCVSTKSLRKIRKTNKYWSWVTSYQKLTNRCSYSVGIGTGRYEDGTPKKTKLVFY